MDEEVMSRKDISMHEEMKKQEYIQRYGLLPLITPLSKQYGRMKCQQQQALGSSNANKPGSKRRGDLLGVASRLGRDRRARLSTQPTLLFDKRPPKKRGREALLVDE